MKKPFQINKKNRFLVVFLQDDHDYALLPELIMNETGII
jgi:hypothetical protein